MAKSYDKSPREKRLERHFGVQVDRDLRSIPKTWFVNINLPSLRGIPDRVGCTNGKFWALELKRDASESRSRGRARLQGWVIEKIRGAGGYAAFAYPQNWDTILEELRGL